MTIRMTAIGAGTCERIAGFGPVHVAPHVLGACARPEREREMREPREEQRTDVECAATIPARHHCTDADRNEDPQAD